MHSTAYVHQLKNGEWEVQLPIPGHLLSDKHPTLHKTKEAALFQLGRVRARACARYGV
jgi:hypothetical protein